jgi:hypothetical protein
MNWLQKLPGFHRSAHGLEWTLWRKLPLILAVGTALPLLGAGAVRLWASEPASAATERLITLADYFAVALVVLHWTTVLTVGIGCIIVMLMKGPAYVADGYAMPHSDRPGPPDAAP